MHFLQELVAYEEMDARNPNLCQRMQLKIIDILLCNVYITKDCYLQKSRILVKKSRLLRACGVDGLNSCIKCLSEAISILVSYLFIYFNSCFTLNNCINCFCFILELLAADKMYLTEQNNTSGLPSSPNAPYCHQLALAYCLRALCTQELDQNLEVVLPSLLF